MAWQPGMFGGTFEAFVERIHPDDRESVLETLENAMKAGTDFSTLHRSIWPDGTVRWLSGAGRFHLGEHGEPVRGIGISRTSPSAARWRSSFSRRRRWKPSGGWPAAWRTTSTTC